MLDKLILLFKGLGGRHGLGTLRQHGNCAHTPWQGSQGASASPRALTAPPRRWQIYTQNRHPRAALLRGCDAAGLGPLPSSEAQKMKAEPLVLLPAPCWPHFPIPSAPRLLHS